MRTEDEIKTYFAPRTAEETLSLLRGRASRLASLIQLRAPAFIVANEAEMVHEAFVALRQKDPRYTARRFEEETNNE